MIEPPAFASALVFIARGTVMTLAITAAVLAIAVPVAVAFALMMSSRTPFLRLMLMLVSGVVRGVPPLILLFIAYFVLPVAGLALTPFAASVAALSLYVVFYLAECIRAGIGAIDVRQRDAIAALGIAPGRAFTRVLLPQVMSVALPPSIGYITEIVKSSALASTISVAELTANGTQMIMATGRPLAILTAVGAIYLVIDLGVVVAQPAIERACGIRGPSRLRRPA